MNLQSSDLFTFSDFSYDIVQCDHKKVGNSDVHKDVDFHWNANVEQRDLNINNDQSKLFTYWDHSRIWCVTDGIDEKVLINVLDNISVLNYSQIKDMAYIVSTCLQSLMQEKILYYKKTQLFELIDGYIKQHLSEELTTPRICEYFHISKSTLYKIALLNYKESINRHVENLRLEHAKKLLSESDFPLNIVAEKCGIQDANYFSKKFKKTYGLSPSAYRKNVLNNK